MVNRPAHNDHIRGNQVFDKEIDIISTARTAELITSLSFKQLVPGHGDIGGLETIVAMKNYINHISDIASELVRNQYPSDSIASLPVPDTYRQWWFENFYHSTLRFIYSRQH